MPDDETVVAGKISSSTGVASRRQAIGVMGTTATAQVPAADPLRALSPALVPRADLVNVLEYEPQARLVLGAAKVAPILGSDRTVTDRITLRPRMNIPTRDLDLTVTLFGDQHFTPIIVGPIADQKRFHAEGEAASGAWGFRGKGRDGRRAAKPVCPWRRSPRPPRLPCGCRSMPKSPKVKDVLAEAGAAKAKAVVVTVNAGTSASGPAAPASARIDWAAVDAVVPEHVSARDREGHHASGRRRGKPSPAAPRAWWCRTIVVAMRRPSRARCSSSRRSFGRWRSDTRARRWQFPPRHGYSQGPRLWCEGRADRPACDVGPSGLRRGRRAGRGRNAAGPNLQDICACAAVHRSRRSMPAWCVFTRLFHGDEQTMADIERCLADKSFPADRVGPRGGAYGGLTHWRGCGAD